MKINILSIGVIFLVGCSTITEPVKVVLGTSTRALENSRIDAVSETYNCNYRECFNAVLALDRKNIELQPINEKFFNVFQKSWEKRLVVVMGVKGQVDTTEVGIFFVNDQQDSTTVEISSLSSSAKRKVADAVFAELQAQFNKVN